ncbi:hypothetical protein [Ferrimonas pelagia]|uniref:Uncharacterized protein n=1 Tax=Ferrimonas pelagia TaxID=1177826 RepID=A0ABP9EC46_9GAMM
MSIKFKLAIAALTTLFLLLLRLDGMDFFVTLICGGLSLYYLAMSGMAMFDRQWQQIAPAAPNGSDRVAMIGMTLLGVAGATVAGMAQESLMVAELTRSEFIARGSVMALIWSFTLSRFAIAWRLWRIARMQRSRAQSHR